MDIRDVNWKKVRILILIPLLIIATIIYGISGCSSDNEDRKSDSGAVELLDRESEKDDSDGNKKYSSEEGDSSGKSEEKIYDEIDGEIFVDVGGAVLYPKVVRLNKGARIYEAIDAAGGCNQNAFTKFLNMAAVCEDGQKIYVPVQSEVETGNISEVVTSSAGYTGNTDSSSGSAVTGAGSGKININTAGSEELQTLTGIGPSMAERIIEHRDENGKFKSVDELTNVSGIGEKTLSKFVNDICV